MERPGSGGGAVICAVQGAFGASAIADSGYSSIGPQIHCWAGGPAGSLHRIIAIIANGMVQLQGQERTKEGRES